MITVLFLRFVSFPSLSFLVHSVPSGILFHVMFAHVSFYFPSFSLSFPSPFSWSRPVSMGCNRTNLPRRSSHTPGLVGPVHSAGVIPARRSSAAARVVANLRSTSRGEHFSVSVARVVANISALIGSLQLIFIFEVYGFLYSSVRARPSQIPFKASVKGTF